MGFCLLFFFSFLESLYFCKNCFKVCYIYVEFSDVVRCYVDVFDYDIFNICGFYVGGFFFYVEVKYIDVCKVLFKGMNGC